MKTYTYIVIPPVKLKHIVNYSQSKAKNPLVLNIKRHFLQAWIVKCIIVKCTTLGTDKKGVELGWFPGKKQFCYDLSIQLIYILEKIEFRIAFEIVVYKRKSQE